MSRVGIAPATAPGLTSREICWRVLRRPDFPTHKGTSTAFKAVSYGTAFLIAPAFFLWQSAFSIPSKTIAECDEKYQEWIFLHLYGKLFLRKAGKAKRKGGLQHVSCGYFIYYRRLVYGTFPGREPPTGRSIGIYKLSDSFSYFDNGDLYSQSSKPKEF